MERYELEYYKFAKIFGIILMTLSVGMTLAIIVLEAMGIGYTGLIQVAVQYLFYGFVSYGIGKIVQYIELHYMEMKYFRKHYIDKKENKKDEY